MSSSAAFDQALALVHDTLLQQQASGRKGGVPLEVLARLSAAVGVTPSRPSLRSSQSAPSAPPQMTERPRPAPVAAPTPSDSPQPAIPESLPVRSSGKFSDQVRAHLSPEVANRTMPPSERPVAAADKATRMNRLREEAAEKLSLSSLPLVFGVGSLDAEVIFIGDAPGAEEEAAGEPFVDEAGQMLTKVIGAMEMSREEVYLTNLLQTRSEQPRGRVLPPEEVALHLPYLIAQIEIIQPKCLIALGGSTVEALLRSGQRIDHIRGHWQKYRGLPLMPTFHVAYLHSTNNPLHKRMVWEDMLAILKHLDRPISRKQLSYFRTVKG